MNIWYCERHVVVCGAEGLNRLRKLLKHHFGRLIPIEHRIVGYTSFDRNKTDEPNLYRVRLRAIGYRADVLATISAHDGELFALVNEGLSEDHPAFQLLDR